MKTKRLFHKTMISPCLRNKYVAVSEAPFPPTQGGHVPQKQLHFVDFLAFHALEGALLSFLVEARERVAGVDFRLSLLFREEAFLLSAEVVSMLRLSMLCLG